MGQAISYERLIEMSAARAQPGPGAAEGAPRLQRGAPHFQSRQTPAGCVEPSWGFAFFKD